MRMPASTAPFASEAELCAAFIALLPKDWTAYPETGGFDILLSRKPDGLQIGVEAKLKLNAKVVAQAAERMPYPYAALPGPDHRAVLIPFGVNGELKTLCSYLGVAVVECGADRPLSRKSSFYPSLPSLADHAWLLGGEGWLDFCPSQRLALPDYVPDVVAGASSPSSLTAWKIGAIKLVVTLERVGYLTREDFAFHKISFPRWRQQGWLVPGSAKWQFIGGPYSPNFRRQHPRNYAEIEADYDKWKRKPPA